MFGSQMANPEKGIEDLRELGVPQGGLCSQHFSLLAPERGVVSNTSVPSRKNRRFSGK